MKDCRDIYQTKGLFAMTFSMKFMLAIQKGFWPRPNGCVR
jgi:hypothetical protein